MSNPLPRRQFLQMAAAGAASLAMASQAIHSFAATPAPAPANTDKPVMLFGVEDPITARDFTQRLQTVEGITPNQLKQHLGLYQGYVKKINEIQTLLKQANPNPAEVNATYHPYRELLVEESFALNGVVLHELYFGNIGGKRAPASNRLKAAIADAFGSWDRYINDLTAAGKAMRGWAMTAYSFRDGKIHNYGMDTHNQWVPIHVLPLVVLDVYEHAYMIDFGTNRGAYLDAFLANMDWDVVEERLDAVTAHKKSRTLT
jgi:Fe-Mn family superoxide dismutase